MNSATFIGRLGQDPKITTTSNGGKVANFSIATQESKDKVEWHTIVAWNSETGQKLADVVEKYLKKGSLVGIEGKMQTRKYDKDGQPRYTTECVARRVHLLGGRPAGEEGEQRSAPAAEPEYANAVAETEDIPF